MYGSEQRTYLKVGAITLVAILLLLAGITIGRGVNITTAPVEVHIRAATAAGLEPGAPVWINGIKRGSIVRVRPDGDSVLIIAGLDDASLLRVDAHAQIAMLELTGGKRVDIFPGRSPIRWDGRIIPADEPADIAELLGAARSIARRASAVLDRLDTTIGALNAVVADPNTAVRIRESLAHMASLVGHLDTLVTDSRAALEATIADLKSSSSQVRTFIEQNRPTVEQLLDRLNRTSADLETLIRDGSHVVARADTTIGELNMLLATLRQQRTAIGKLLYDDKLARDLESSIGRLGGILDTLSRYGINVNVRLGTRP